MLIPRSDFEKGLSLIRGRARLVVDVESTGLSPHLGDRICGVAVWTGEENSPPLYFPIRHMEDPDNLTEEQYRKLISTLNVETITGFNTKFDLRMLRRDGGRWRLAEDVMLAVHLLNENEESFRLKDLGTKYVDPTAADAQKELDSLLAERGLKKGEMWKLRGHEVEEYACQDVVITEKLRAICEVGLSEWSLSDLWQEVNEYMLAVLEMEDWGIQLDVPLIHQYMEEADSKEKELLDKLREEAGYPINPRSNPQMQAFLGLPSTKAEILEEMAGSNPAIDLVIAYRQWNRVNSTYYKPWLEKATGGGILHPNLLLHGTISGRLAARNPNTQAIPRTRGEAYKVKDIIVARPGFVLANLDYSQAEIRLFAHYAQDPVLQDIFMRDGDTHGEVAQNLGLHRDVAKRINLGTVYGLGAKGLASRIKIPLAEAQTYMDRYHTAHPNTRKLYNELQRRAERTGHIRMWTGRTRRYNTPSAAPHKALSNLIQGGVAEIVRHAITELARRFEGSEARMLLQVHDSILFEFPEDQFRQCMIAAKEAMEGVGGFSVPLKVDAAYGPRWGDMETWNG